MFGSEEVNTSVFHLLAIACTNLMKSSIRCNLQQQADSFLDNFIYSRILWSKCCCSLMIILSQLVSVHLKCVSEKDMITGSTADIWQQPILGVRPYVNLHLIILNLLAYGIAINRVKRRNYK